MAEGLTRRQDELLTFLQSSARTPSYDEMRDRLGLASKSGVHRLLDALEERGFIERLPQRARAIRVLAKPRPWDVGIGAYETPELFAELRRRGVLQ